MPRQVKHSQVLHTCHFRTQSYPLLHSLGRWDLDANLGWATVWSVQQQVMLETREEEGEGIIVEKAGFFYESGANLRWAAVHGT